MIDNLSVAVPAFDRSILMSFSVEEMLLLRYVNLSTKFKEPPFRVIEFPWILYVLLKTDNIRHSFLLNDPQ